MGMKHWLRAGGRFLSRHSTKLLTGSAILSELLGFWFMHKEAPKAHEKLNALDPDATLWDKVKAVGPVYLPAIGMLILSSGSMVAGCAIGEAKLAEMTATAIGWQATAQQYHKELVKQLGPDKAQELHDQAARAAMREHPVTSDKLIYTTHGKDIFYDSLSGRRFTSCIDFVERAKDRLNGRITGGMDMWASVNEWYEELDIPDIPLGGYSGWNIDDKLAIAFNSHPNDSGEIVTEIIYYTLPVLYDGREPKRLH